ncbi:MAG: hypothetical protein NTX24_03130 [Candidatus Pacearchaeota archaeon]|nr:hypothetical protein [Candidatus Pacearchaeota archaeon]
MAGKIEAIQGRIFKNIFICKKCGAKLRTESRKIAEGKVRCRTCKGDVFRPKSRKVTK